MDSGLARLGRAAGAASLSTLAALTLHTIAGGHSPALAAVLVPWGASFAVAVQLSGKPLSRCRLAVIVALSQLAFHTLFTIGAVGSPTVRHTHHGGALDVIPAAAATHAPSMPLAHVGAALITYLGIRRASTLTAALKALFAVASQALAPRAVAEVRTWLTPHIVPSYPAPTVRRQAVHLGSRPLRGPPAPA